MGVEAQQLQALPIFQGLLYHRCIQPRLRYLGCYLRDGDRPPTGVRQGQDRVEDQVERVARAGLRVEGAFCSGRGGGLAVRGAHVTRPGFPYRPRRRRRGQDRRSTGLQRAVREQRVMSPSMHRSAVPAAAAHLTQDRWSRGPGSRARAGRRAHGCIGANCRPGRWRHHDAHATRTGFLCRPRRRRRGQDRRSTGLQRMVRRLRVRSPSVHRSAIPAAAAHLTQDRRSRGPGS